MVGVNVGALVGLGLGVAVGLSVGVGLGVGVGTGGPTPSTSEAVTAGNGLPRTSSNVRSASFDTVPVASRFTLTRISTSALPPALIQSSKVAVTTPMLWLQDPVAGGTIVQAWNVELVGIVSATTTECAAPAVGPLEVFVAVIT